MTSHERVVIPVRTVIAVLLVASAVVAVVAAGSVGLVALPVALTVIGAEVGERRRRSARTR